MFSGLTLGFLSLDKVGLEIVKGSANAKQAKYAKRIIPIRKDGNLLLCTLLLGNVAVNSLLSILLADITGGLFGFIISTAVILLFGEIFPQALCSRYSLKIGGAAVPVVRVCIVLLYPIAKPIALTLDCILGRDVGTIHSRSELLKLLAIHVEEKALDDETGKVMQGALKTLHEMKVSQIMTPVEDVFMLPIEGVLDYKTVTQIFQCGFSRIPVYRGTMNNIVGVLFTKDLILVDPDDATPLAAFLQIFARSLEVLDENQSVSSAFRRFRAGGSHMGLVRRVPADSSGRASSELTLKGSSPLVRKFESIGTLSTHAASMTGGRDDPGLELVGVLTLEDIVEEIIQEEIIDETDVYVDVDNRVEVPGDRSGLNEQRLRMLNAQLLEEPLTADETRAIALHLIHNQPALSKELDQKSVEWLLENAEVRTYNNQHRTKVRVADSTAAIRTESSLSERDTHPPTTTADAGSSSPRTLETDNAWIYRRGVETDMCCIVLTGRLAVLAGQDQFRSESGAFSVLAIEALLHEHYSPDFSARVGSEKVRCINIRRSLYNDALHFKNTGYLPAPSSSIGPANLLLPCKIGRSAFPVAQGVSRSGRAQPRQIQARIEQRILLSQQFIQKRSSERNMMSPDARQLRRSNSAFNVGDREKGRDDDVEGDTICAAFDYWKALFPNTNVEFPITCIYQAGAVLTVAALSMGRTFKFKQRIYGAFVGQFMGLLVVLVSRWISLGEAALYTSLMILVFDRLFLSIVTAFADSSLLALNSQYSPKMQEAMQIGVGLSTFVSVMYRDTTKLMAASVADATSIYFGAALATVITAIPCVTFTSLDHDHWFQTILLTVYTAADVIGRFSVRFRGPLNYSNIWITAVFLALLVPILILCASGIISNDWVSLCSVLVFGLANGLTADELEATGRFSAVSLNLGLCMGGFLAMGIGLCMGIAA
ncbi:Metal transporter cnnm2 [Perkinsus chesapeaki]|uniref:Metal transporter cnnm2 n=1 Tax=Perkinsus chesapeaki TaxID=330153 RepID=A0A7J6MCV0_PERCH|nr:Metal transporter cnnm2 [Perkinsus chesapeaki]